MTILLWARHGENGANVSRTLSHRRLDPGLTDRGVQQARDLAERLTRQDEAVGLVVSSPLRRARETAAVVTERLGLPPAAAVEELRELDVGSLDGRSDEQAWQTYLSVLAAWSAGDTAMRFPDGEDHRELVERLQRGLVRAARSGQVGGPGQGGAGSRSGAVLAVAHGGNLGAAVQALTGTAPPQADLPLAGIARLVLDDSGRLELTRWDSGWETTG